MRLFRQTLIFFLAFMLVAAAGSIYVRKSIVLSAYFKVESERDRQDAERLLIAFNKKVQTLLLVTKDYAIWDRPYQFLIDKDVSKIKNDFLPISLKSLGIDFFAFVEMPSANIVWQEYIEPEPPAFSDKMEKISLEPLIKAIALKQSRLSRPWVAGYSKIDQQLILFSAVQILPSSGKGTSAGMLIFGQKVDQKFLQELSELSQVQFSFAPVATQPSVHNALAQQYRDENNRFLTVLNDWRGAALETLVIQFAPRTFNDNLIGVAGIVGLLTMLLFSVIGFWLLNNYLISPLLKITNHLATVIDTRNYSLRLNDQHSNELGILSRKTDELLSCIEDQDKQLRQQAEMLRQISLRDPLTGIANRRAFDEHFSRDIAQAIRNNKPLALLFFDIDYFKDYNDHYGHSAGDRILVKVGQILSHYCQRASDLVSRYGGEEFVLLLPDTNHGQAESIAEKIREAVVAENIPHERSPYKHLTLSIGISVMTNPSLESADLLLDAADKALYKAKEMGRNRLQIM
jgi:diguanylate cyclase (GGDEF)-like protein